MSTNAYDLQCKQSDAKELITLLQETYKTDPQFVFHRIRHRDLNAYKNAIRKQNFFLAKSRIDTIKGVTMEAMFYISNEISQIPGVLDTFPHKDLAHQGRWSITTDTTHLQQLWTPTSLAGLVFILNIQITTYEDHSDATFSTYMSAFTNTYAIQDDSCNHPPQFNGPSLQA